MHLRHLPLLVCPRCQSDLTCDAATPGMGELIDGAVRCSGCGVEYPVVGGIARFVPRENYASGFGLEWLRHARTQYDSHCGLPLSQRRFATQTQWPRDLSGELVLEVGSGSGRFTEQAANTGATIVSFDYSYAVEANYASNGTRPNVLIVQADVFAMPFRPGTFDRVFCFGVLQHTPDPARAFAALPRMLRGGGALCADIYKATLVRALLHTKYYVRPFTRRMNPDRLYARRQGLGGFHVAARRADPSRTAGLRDQLAAAGRGLQSSGVTRRAAEGVVVSRHVSTCLLHATTGRCACGPCSAGRSAPD